MSLISAGSISLDSTFNVTHFVIPSCHMLNMDRSIPQWLLSAVRDLTRYGRLSTYDVSVLKLSNVSFRGKYARMGNTLKIPSPTNLAWLGRFPAASQEGCSMSVSFLWLDIQSLFGLLGSAVLIGWDSSTPPSPPPAFGLIYEAKIDHISL
jgi:hypothetical protein